MLDKSTAIEVILRRYRKMKTGDALELLTWKRDRSLLIRKQGEDTVVVHEQGYRNEEYLVPFTKLRKLMKVLLKREFPRSHKIRLRSICQQEVEDKFH